MQPTASRSRNLLIGAAVLLILAVGGYFVWSHLHHAHGHSHGSEDGDAPVLVLNDGKRWSTDEALRTGMQRMRDAAALALDKQRQGPLQPEESARLATAVQDNVNYLIQNCRLEPKADAVLHVFITELLEGASLVNAKPPAPAGLEKLAHALNEYPKYFDHPGWVPIPGVVQ